MKTELDAIKKNCKKTKFAMAKSNLETVKNKSDTVKNKINNVEDKLENSILMQIDRDKSDESYC